MNKTISCNFALEACYGIPIHYDNWYEHIAVDLTEEQFERYCETLKHWRMTDEWKNWNSDNGEDFFIKRDLPDIYDMVMKKVIEQAPKIWDERIMNYIDQLNLITADEIYFKVLEEE